MIALTDLNPEKITLEFKGLNQSDEVEIQLIDRNQATSRPLLATNMRQRGDPILVRLGYFREYLLQFEQKSFQEEDETAHCWNYPTKGFKNYEECDKENVRLALKYLNLSDLMPVWATKNMEEVTDRKEMKFDEISKVTFADIFSGYSETFCLDPCTTTISYSKFLSENVDATNGTYIQLIIANDVPLEKTELITFNFLLSLSFLGSNMGLWLGLGAVQLVEILGVLIMKRMRAVM